MPALFFLKKFRAVVLKFWNVGIFVPLNIQTKKMQYRDFLESKIHVEQSHGVEPLFLPEILFDYQRHVAEYAIRRGRSALFLDTGLGKTGIELTVAHNFALHTNKPVLIITPLAVAFQFVAEAAKFGIEDVEYSKDGKHTKKIVVCNYERLEKFDPANFDCVILDESSILKNFDGAIKTQITAFVRKVKYRFLFTATPSPNDYIELGTSSEALGYLGYMDMLGRFFKNNQDSADIRHSGSDWYLKPHAEKDFWRWVASWSISMRKPSDLGFSDERHILPELTEIDTVIQNTTPLTIGGQMQLFAKVAKTFSEVRAEVKATVRPRCEKACEKSMQHQTSVYWVNLNEEGTLIGEIDKDAVELRGQMKLEQKEEILLAFSRGEIGRLITKPTITGFGLNWQHCNHTSIFPTFSFEQYYQAVRRFHRFGQQNPVTVDRIFSDGQIRVLQSLDTKANKTATMFANLVSQTNQSFQVQQREFSQQITFPAFLTK